MKSNALKASWILLVIVYSIGSILSLILIFQPTFFIASQFELATGQKLIDFAESNPQAYSFLLFFGDILVLVSYIHSFIFALDFSIHSGPH